MGIRTDLALESAQQVETSSGQALEGIEKNESKKANLTISQITVKTEKAAKALEKPIGEYVTITSKTSLEAYPDDFNQRVEAVSEELIRLCGDFSSVLVIGLGNKQITPDSLGPKVAEQIFATRHIKKLAQDMDTSDLNDVSVIATGVMGQTGIEAAEIVKAVVEKTSPSKVIVIDALACSEVSHLGATIQLTNTGISPGSGVENARKELSKSSLGVDVIAVGVPTVVDMQTIAENVFKSTSPYQELKGMMVTPRAIDKLIDRTVQLLSMSINKAFQPNLTIEDITSLVN